jgi:hypothetical protein
MRIRSHIRNNVVAYVAVFFSLSGVTYAIDGPLAGQNTVGSADIINGEVYNQDIQASSVGSGKVADNSLTAGDLAAHSVGFSELHPAAFAKTDIAPTCIQQVVCTYQIPPDAIQSGEIQNGEVHKVDLASDAGPDGYASFDDDTGIICNSSCQEGSLQNLPAGSYAIFGKIHVDQPMEDEDRLNVICRLHAGQDFDDAKVSLMGPRPASPTQGRLDLRASTLNMQVVHTFTANNGKAYINCRDEDVGDARGWDLKITAISLGSLSNVHSDSGPDS